MTHRHEPPATRQVLTIAQFCDEHQISRGFFNVLKQRGEAPDFIKIGRRVLIPTAAAAEWRQRLTVRAAP
jgi:hypothetical protein